MTPAPQLPAPSPPRRPRRRWCSTRRIRPIRNGKRFVGSAIWRTETGDARPGSAARAGDARRYRDPGAQVAMTWSLRRNTDKALPASHTVEIMFKLPADFPAGGISNVPGILMKQAEQTRGVPLAGLCRQGHDRLFPDRPLDGRSGHAAQHPAAQGARLVRRAGRLQQRRAAPSWRSRRARPASAPSPKPSRRGSSRNKQNVGASAHACADWVIQSFRDDCHGRLYAGHPRLSFRKTRRKTRRRWPGQARP